MVRRRANSLRVVFTISAAMVLSIKTSSVATERRRSHLPPRRPLIGRPSPLPFSLPPPQSRLLKKQLVRRGRGEEKGREESGRITPLLSASPPPPS